MNPYLRVIDALIQRDVRYVVAGGFAALLHGNNRFTADLDLVVDLSPEQARRAIEALTSLGYMSRIPVDPLRFADPSTREEWVREKRMTVFSMFDAAKPSLVVDLFAVPPMDFEELYRHAVTMPVAGLWVRVASIEDLIRMKTATGREIDALDARNLREIQSRAAPNQGTP